MAHSGRPTKLTPELMKKAESYLEWCENNPLERLFNGKDGVQRVKVPKPPTINGLGLFLDTDKDVLNIWERKNAKFHSVCSRVRAKYEELLADNGITDQYNSRMAMFLSSTDLGKREKFDTSVNGEVKVLRLDV